MQIPGAEKAIQNIMKWSAREDWDAYREDLFSEHFDVACEDFDLTVDEIANLMGPSFNSLFGFVFEDF
ncbi:MAG: hypothetical protein VCD66_02785, partial [Alphaproteobacteria bacterium]